MKRKTNLFYLSGPDSKFITFSNYTECLTGNFLSTNTKMFPSRFLCLNVKGLTKENRKYLIGFLTEYYESKLAVLRDNLETLDNNISPLNYLLEGLSMINSINDDGIDYDINFNNIISKNKIFDIPYISDITEQDYNGTYTDTICIVNLSNVYSGEILFSSKAYSNNAITINIPKYNNTETPCLYGWENGTITDYKDALSIFDEINGDEGKYYITSLIDGIKYNNSDTTEEITFNVIIPLFDMVNIDYKSNFNLVNEDTLTYNNDEYNGMDLTNSENNNLYIKNIPLGIWFSDNEVTIKNDLENGFSENWSLVISSQFKPFPYSKSMPNEINNNAILSNSFITFSQILSRQNSIIDSFNKILNNINNLNERINNIESNLKNVSTISSLDDIHKELALYESKMNENLNTIQNNILSYLNNLKWNSSTL